MARTFAPFWPRIVDSCACVRERPENAAEIYVQMPIRSHRPPSSAHRWLRPPDQGLRVSHSFEEPPARTNDMPGDEGPFRQQTREHARCRLPQNVRPAVRRFEQLLAAEAVDVNYRHKCGDMRRLPPRRRKSRASPKREMLNSRMAAPFPFQKTKHASATQPPGPMAAWPLENGI